MSAAMVKNPAEAATVMPASSATEKAAPALPLTTNMTASSLTSGGNSCLDEQIDRLKRCEYLREGEVKPFACVLERFWWMNPTCSEWMPQSRYVRCILVVRAVLSNLSYRS